LTRKLGLIDKLVHEQAGGKQTGLALHLVDGDRRLATDQRLGVAARGVDRTGKCFHAVNDSHSRRGLFSRRSRSVLRISNSEVAQCDHEFLLVAVDQHRIEVLGGEASVLAKTLDRRFFVAA
jgi:hypothetical protein